MAWSLALCLAPACPSSKPQPRRYLSAHMALTTPLPCLKSPNSSISHGREPRLLHPALKASGRMASSPLPQPSALLASTLHCRLFLPAPHILLIPHPPHLLTQRVLTRLLPGTLASGRTPPRLGHWPSTAGILPPQKGREGRGCKASSSVV